MDNNIQDTLNERSKTHGDFEAQSTTAQLLRGTMVRTDGWVKLSPPMKESLQTIAHKISRILHGDSQEPDHWRDIAGYATLIENILVHGRSHIGGEK